MVFEKLTDLVSYDPLQRRSFLSLRLKMMLYFSLLFIASFASFELIILFGIPFTKYEGELKLQQSDAFRNLNLVADLKKEPLINWVKERVVDINVLSESKIVREAVTKLLDKIVEFKASGMNDQELWTIVQRENIYQSLIKQLRLVLKHHHFYAKIETADSETGLTIASTDSADLGTNVYRKYPFLSSKNRVDTLTVNTVKIRESGKFRLLVTLPVMEFKTDSNRDNTYGEMAGAILIMHVDTENIVKPMFLNPLEGLGGTGEALLVDQDVKILTPMNYKLMDEIKSAPMGYQINSKPALMAANGEEGIIISKDYRGVPVLAAYRYIPITSGLGWGMVVKRDRDEVYAPMYRKMGVAFFSALICIFITLVLAYGVSDNLSRPIKILSRKAEQVASGDFSVRAGETSYSEARILVSTFNSMVKRIGDWHSELEEVVKNRTAELKLANKTLKNVVKIQKEGEKELEQLNIELKDKNKELEQIIFVASHDLRSPLVNIHGFTKIIGETLKSINSIINNDNVSSSVKEKLRPFLEKDLPESIDFILNSSSKLDILVSGLIKVSRLGQKEINIAPLDMNKLIGTVVKTFGYQIRKDGPTLEINELPPCRGDIVQINQAFSNLLDNALKYLSPNRQGKIIISAQKKVKEVVYCVEDNGMGIDAKNKKRIFEIFLRLNPQTSTGDGLGLAIVNKIIIRHRGKVWVESEPGKGSKFFVSLPA